MRKWYVAILGMLAVYTARAAVVEQDATIEGVYTTIVVTPDAGCIVEDFLLQATGDNLAGDAGLLQEGFGVGSFYVPNRRLNERLEIDTSATGQPVLTYTYNCDGPNIEGIHVIRTMEPLPNEASIRVTWRLEHRGDKSQWIAPWVRNDFTPGNAAENTDRLDVPTLDGMVNAQEAAYHRASRNWVAATDPSKSQTIYAVFDADRTFSFLTHRGMDDRDRAAVQTNFAPTLIAPGDTWQTTYRVNIVRGLQHIDFASDELAAQIDYENGQLQMRLSAARALPQMEINATVVGPDGQATTLAPKRFELDPTRVIRCTWDWTAPQDGPYDLLAQVSVNGQPYMLGAETKSPHGGIDARFTVGGKRAYAMEAWTDAPFLLERGSRTLERALAAGGDTAIWFESPLNKLFREDQVKSTGSVDPTGRIALARNESESIQLALRPQDGQPIQNLSVRVRELKQNGGRGAIGAENVRVHRVGYVPIEIPSYFEGPTGMWPDPLPPLDGPVNLPAGVTTPFWITIHAPAETPPGTYTGLVEVSGAGLEPVELWLEATVYDFTLPDTPALKTDFGFSLDAAATQAQAAGFGGSNSALADAYRALAFENRITLRSLAALPAESADYASTLANFEPKLDEYRKNGASVFYVPDSLLDVPAQLAMANDFVKDQGLTGRVFTQLAEEPARPAWQRVFERAQAWREAAPDIPVMITTYGIEPFLTDAAGIWAVHSPMLDTTNNSVILERAKSKTGDVWWYVNHAPPRPYANFFLDFAAMEHRVLFWQTWVLGFTGMHYWAVNYADEDENPYATQLDITPVNGDGFLLYPGPRGPVSSIRWETIRDGIEDFDYLALMSERVQALDRATAPDHVLRKVEAAQNLKDLVASLTDFSREPSVLEAQRRAVAEAIMAMDAVAGR